MRPFVRWCRFAFVKVNRLEGRPATTWPGGTDRSGGAKHRRACSFPSPLRSLFFFFFLSFPATLLGASQESLSLSLSLVHATTFSQDHISPPATPQQSQHPPLLSPTSFRDPPPLFSPLFPTSASKPKGSLVIGYMIASRPASSRRETHISSNRVT